MLQDPVILLVVCCAALTLLCVVCGFAPDPIVILLTALFCLVWVGAVFLCLRQGVRDEREED